MSNGQPRLEDEVHKIAPKQLNGESPWQHVVSEEEMIIYQRAGFGNSFKGDIRPALLVIDVQYRSMGHANLPILESIETEYPTSCGQYGWRAVPHIARLIHAFRERQLPVLFPHVAFKENHDGQRFADKVPAAMSISRQGYEMIKECAPLEGDILVPKHHASAFFGTPLVSYLTTKNINCVVITGTTTSGCVRASAVDASSYGYRVIVPHDAVYDRSQTSHAVNLFDMNSKYADVMSTDDALKLAPLASIQPIE
ncbi:isochorismatase family protein [Candidimonas sp. SYP-B2681]|uniref:isochorismatase family protein n=1 Tax=Candidimonas sp. SYP-B2681 TaxID=2497686 RepID=UPI000F884D5C|nr:isochorismatase family protein [Candidimonas sp. SYP-B2681]RTZ41468.1 isochorismatase family protein [Candidimonas sp. SYP-B2681]